MKTTIDYSKSASPAFQAVEDIKDYFGDRWARVSAEMRRMSDHNQFHIWASFAGVEGYPVEAWYDLYWGQGEYRRQCEHARRCKEDKVTFHQKLSARYFDAAQRSMNCAKHDQWMHLSAAHGARARRHLFELLKGDY